MPHAIPQTHSAFDPHRNLFINKDYHFNGSFEDGLKEKLLARYTVVFFPIQSNIFVLLQHELG